MGITIKPRTPSVGWAVMACVLAVGKAAVAGAGVSLATFGIADLSSIPIVSNYITETQMLNVVAFGGGALGVVVQIAVSWLSKS